MEPTETDANPGDSDVEEEGLERVLGEEVVGFKTGAKTKLEFSNGDVIAFSNSNVVWEEGDADPPWTSDYYFRDGWTRLEDE